MKSLRLYSCRFFFHNWLWLSTSATLFVSLASTSVQFSRVGRHRATNAFVICKFHEGLTPKYMLSYWPRRSGHCDGPLQSAGRIPVYSYVRRNDVIMCASSDNKQRKSRGLTRRSSRANTASEDTAQHQVLNEFSAKAALILAEAGGRMLASNFKRRWKFTFPDDSMDRLRRVKPTGLGPTALTLVFKLAGTNRADRSQFASFC
jgi:hypothetical protein